jgi:adenylate kinase
MNRLNQVDCYLQGTVIEGFPVTESQIGCLEQLKINPSLVIVVDVKPDFAI